MRCPYCGHPESKVIDSRDVEDGIRRRRECLSPHCGQRFTTYERMELAALWVVKRDGRRERFSREKLVGGLLKACAKRPVSIETIEKMVEEIEGVLQRHGRAEVPASAVGELVMEHLRAIDSVAYIRFASVYRHFQDVEHFRQEVEALRDTVARSPKAVAGQLPLLPQEEFPSQRAGARKRREPRPRRQRPPAQGRPRLATGVGASPRADSIRKGDFHHG
ncbi:MAG: transcriptional regulator NrdR [Dehalococcoidia bacterium]